MNGWKNKETWLVNIWYMDVMPEYFADMEQFEVDASELEDAVTYLCEECEAFIRDSWREVDWHELAKHLNLELSSMQGES